MEEVFFSMSEKTSPTLLSTELFIEGSCIEINIRKKRPLLVCTYNSNKNLISNHLKEIRKNFNNCSSKYDSFILLGDLNSEPTESTVRDFCQIYGSKNLIKDNTCFKNTEKHSRIDLIITKQAKMLSKFCGIRNRVVRFLSNDINGNESILQKTKANHYPILQL